MKMNLKNISYYWLIPVFNLLIYFIDVMTRMMYLTPYTNQWSCHVELHLSIQSSISNYHNYSNCFWNRFSSSIYLAVCNQIKKLIRLNLCYFFIKYTVDAHEQMKVCPCCKNCLHLNIDFLKKLCLILYLMIYTELMHQCTIYK